MSDRVYVGRKLGEFESSPAFEPVTKVILWYDDESSYAAGDDGGRVLELTCPWATQAMAENILASVSGFVYRPFSGTGALLDPAAELGDAVTVNGVYSMLATMDTNFDALCLSDISAPADEEVDHEYPYQSPQGRELRRKVSLEQKYYGTKISRREGLVIEKTDGDSVEARVVLNAEKLAFYDGSGQEQLYFDPAEGVYKFRGALNVNDNFIVDKLGNIVSNGSMTINGSLIMNGSANWLQTRYSTNKNASIPNQWQEAWDSAWDNTSTQVWVIYSYNGGQNWTQPMLAQGKDGAQGETGPQGSAANVPAWVKAYTSSAEFDTLVTDEWVVTMNLFGSKIFGTEIYGGKITSDTTIDVGTDATIGRWLKLKSPTGKGQVGIVFHGNAIGEAPGLWSDNDKFINISAQYLGLIGAGLADSSIGLNTPLLDLTLVDRIEWGDNKPTAYFG